MEPLKNGNVKLLKSAMGKIHLAMKFAELLVLLSDETMSLPADERKYEINHFIEHNKYSEKDLMYVSFFYNMGYHGKIGRNIDVEERLRDGDKLALLDDLGGSWYEITDWKEKGNLLIWAYQKRGDVIFKRISDGVNLVKESFDELSKNYYLWEN